MRSKSAKNIKKMKKTENRKRSDLNQIISAVAHANLFCVPALPESISLGMDAFELVLSLVMMGDQE